jgi:(p)ppGpp synthase/HD superfamily hydrolase
MQKFKTLADVVALAEFAHRNQTDKAGLPYIEHPRRVMQNVQAQGAMPYVQMAAILHDVTEDTAFTCGMLLTLGVPEAAVEIVRLVDRGASEVVHMEYNRIKRLKDKGALAGPVTGDELASSIYTKDEFYYRNIRNNPAALQVKLADIGDNLQPWRLSYLPVEKQEYLRDKYAKAINLLTGE